MSLKIIAQGGGDVSVTTPDTVTATVTGIYGDWADAIITVATDTDISAEVDLGSSFHQLQIQIPALDSTNIGIEVSETAGGTFKRLGDGGALIQAGEGDFITTVGLSGYQFIKIRTTAEQSANRTFRVRGSNV